MRKIFLFLTLFSSSNLFAQNGWQQISIPTVSGYSFSTIFFTSNDTGFLYYKKLNAQLFQDGRIFMTTNGGSSFFQNGDMILTYAYFKNSSTGWLIGYKVASEVSQTYYYVLKTTDGTSFTVEEQLTNASQYTNCIKFINDNTGWKTKSLGGGVFKTTDGGTTWDSIAANNLGTFPIDYFTVNQIDAVNNRLTAFNSGGSIRYSTNSGSTWATANAGSAIKSKPHYEFMNGINFLATAIGAYKTLNYGINWGSLGLSGARDISAINTQYIWVSDLSGNVKFSSDGGASFENQFSAGGTYDSTSIFMFPADSLNHITGYVNLAGKLYKTTTGGQIIASISNNEITVPKNFGVTIYPNPFNPASKIKVESSIFIKTLSINLYDLTGKLVKSISYSNITPGINEFTLETSGLPTGSYFLKTTTESYSETRKMVLIK